MHTQDLKHRDLIILVYVGYKKPSGGLPLQHLSKTENFGWTEPLNKGTVILNIITKIILLSSQVYLPL